MAEISNLGLGADNPYLGKDNPYLQSIIDMTTKDMTDAYGRTAIPAYNAAMIKSGSFGNTGLDEMAGAGAKALQGSIGDAASKLRFNDYLQQQDLYKWDRNTQQNQNQFDDQFGRSVFNDAYSQNQQNLQTGVGLIDWMSGRNSADAATAQGLYDSPMKYLQQFSGLAQGLGGMGGTQTAGSTSNPVATALGGAQLGSSFSDWWSKKNSTPSSSSSDSGGWWA